MEEKRNVRKAVVLTFGIVILVVVILVLGIPVLLKLTSFLGNFRSSGGIVDKTDLFPPAPPSLNIPYDATNSSRQTINGWAEADSMVYLTKNGQSLGSQKTDSTGAFSFGDVTLEAGDNTFVAVAVDQAANKSQPSDETNLFYSSKSPELTLESPTDRQQVSGSSPQVTIKGVVMGVERLTVNGRVVVVGPDGKFATNYSLSLGENVLVFVAIDRAGNQTRKELIVIAIP